MPVLRPLVADIVGVAPWVLHFADLNDFVLVELVQRDLDLLPAGVARFSRGAVRMQSGCLGAVWQKVTPG